MTVDILSGAGLGLRRALLSPLSSLLSDSANSHPAIDFMEVAPENWIGVGGRLGRDFRKFTEQYDFVFHGLSLSIGGPEPLDVEFVKSVKHFMDEHGVKVYSEHLSYCSDGGHMYDLMPLPHTEEAVRHVSARIKQVQDIIERPLVIENVSAYAQPHKEMEEIDFLNAVLTEADCELLLDINNIYVNSINHKFDPYHYLDQIPADRIHYLHVAGHYDEAEDLLVDTHGSDIKSEVWDMLAYAYQKFGKVPTLLERDFNFPPIEELLLEVEKIRQMQNSILPDGFSQSGKKAL